MVTKLCGLVLVVTQSVWVFVVYASYKCDVLLFKINRISEKDIEYHFQCPFLFFALGGNVEKKRIIIKVLNQRSYWCYCAV